MTKWSDKLLTTGGIINAIKEVSRKIKNNSRKGPLPQIVGYHNQAEYETLSRELIAKGYVEVEPNHWVLKPENLPPHGIKADEPATSLDWHTIDSFEDMQRIYLESLKNMPKKIKPTIKIVHVYSPSGIRGSSHPLYNGITKKD